jgi:hypothetical protein
MTDRELLEAAARAAGIAGTWQSASPNGVPQDCVAKGIGPNLWNPLTDDGDALRLAVKLNFVVAIKGHECEVFSETGDCLASIPIMGASCFENPADATNPYAATRRAIVKAAAQLESKP